VSSGRAQGRSYIAPEQEELAVALRRLLHVTGASLQQRAQLENALETRIVVEQAKGMLAERLRLSLDEAFELLRGAARTARRRVHELAGEVLEEPETPAVLLAQLNELLRPRNED
jgi:AmiR/NasT family two-component response regulator